MLTGGHECVRLFSCLFEFLHSLIAQSGVQLSEICNEYIDVPLCDANRVSFHFYTFYLKPRSVYIGTD